MTDRQLFDALEALVPHDPEVKALVEDLYGRVQAFKDNVARAGSLAGPESVIGQVDAMAGLATKLSKNPVLAEEIAKKVSK